jgi:hypothetical protein
MVFAVDSAATDILLDNELTARFSVYRLLANYARKM